MNELAGAAFAHHDHERCFDTALRRAAEICRERGARLTEQRRRILALIWDSHRPVGAYELLDRLRGSGLNAAPPTVYRALDFLLVQGFVHRIESLNAFVGCVHPGQPHRAQFLICNGCQCVAELEAESVSHAIHASSADLGFRAQRQTVEVHGLCSLCRGGAPGG